MTDREWDKRLHIHTIGREDESNPNYAPYEPTPYAVLERIAERGLVRRKSRLIDYGCGKGRVACFMASVVGCRATGIDQSQKLIDIAIENRKSARLGDRIQLVRALAEQYEPTQEDVFFFFNPFSEKIFESVVRRVVASWQASPRPMTLLCYYPSDAYIEVLASTPELIPQPEIDCGDLFNGKNAREKIVVYTLP